MFSVESERQRERERLDSLEEDDRNEADESNLDLVNDWYRILKNNRILGQVLKNRYGSLRKDKIEELIGVVADGGLRLVNSLLKDEREISELASFLAESQGASDMNDTRRMVRMFSFLWTMINIGEVVNAIGFRQVREVVDQVVRLKASPAYELIGYFSALNSAERLTSESTKKLKGLLAKHDDNFVRNVLSLRTQHYINTHRSGAEIEQAVCAALDIPYKQRMMEARRR